MIRTLLSPYNVLAVSTLFILVLNFCLHSIYLYRRFKYIPIFPSHIDNLCCFFSSGSPMHLQFIYFIEFQARIVDHFPSEFLRILLKVESYEFQVYDLTCFNFSYSDYFEFQHNMIDRMRIKDKLLLVVTFLSTSIITPKRKVESSYT